MKVVPHAARFRHNTPDIEWLAVVGEKRWIVLMRDLKIGKRPMELNALLAARVRAFALQEGQLPDTENARIVLKALPEMLRMLREHPYPFIARIRLDGTVHLWKVPTGKLRG